MYSNPSEYYNSRLLAIQNELLRNKRKLNYLFFGRIGAFFLFIGCLITYIVSIHSSYLLLGSFVSFVLFLAIAKLDLTYAHIERVLKNRMVINQDELSFLEHKYQTRNTGEKYISFNPHLATDFDLFGEGSLFQYLNRSSSKMGEMQFAKELTSFEHRGGVILERQNAIRELTSKLDFMEDFRALGLLLSETGSEYDNLKSWLDRDKEDLKFMKIFAYGIPVLNILVFSTVFLGFLPAGWITFSYFLGLGIMAFYLKRVNKAHSSLDNSAKIFEQYTSLIQLVEKERFESNYLINLVQQFKHSHHQASEALGVLSTLLNRFDLRRNFIFSAFINPFILLDLQIFMRLSNWKAKHKTDVDLWFIALSELDALMSYSAFAFNNQRMVVYPTPSQSEFVFNATDMGHPLLDPNMRVNNSIEFHGSPSIIIVTGANMAGKSTFLRTLAVNLILAMKGAPVCAKEFIFLPCDILSSIKIQDSLSNNQSYFYAELLRIKEIINHVSIQPRTFVVLDEILRGTNTKDKQQGSLGLLQKLIALEANVIIATHDLVIGELQNGYPQIVSNHCFEVELTNDQLIFDYKLKSGISQKLNASFLMKKMGIIAE